MNRAANYTWERGDVIILRQGKGYNPHQPRDDHGRWSDSGGGTAVADGQGSMTPDGMYLLGLTRLSRGSAGHFERMQQALDSMPAHTIELAAANINTIHTFESSGQLTKYMRDMGADVPFGLEADGAYDPVAGDLLLNGDTDAGDGPIPGSGMETIIHELSHAVDASGIKTHGVMHSETREWNEIWQTEINFDEIFGTPPLTNYAATHPAEGWAEFGRLLFTQPEEAKADFPMAYRYWQEKGVL